MQEILKRRVGEELKGFGAVEGIVQPLVSPPLRGGWNKVTVECGYNEQRRWWQKWSIIQLKHSRFNRMFHSEVFSCMSVVF